MYVDVAAVQPTVVDGGESRGPWIMTVDVSDNAILCRPPRRKVAARSRSMALKWGGHDGLRGQM